MYKPPYFGAARRCCIWSITLNAFAAFLEPSGTGSDARYVCGVGTLSHHPCVCRMRERPDLRATGRVVAILEPTPRRNRIVGVLQKGSETTAVLVPVDMRLPPYQTKLSDLPADLRQAAEARHCNSLP